MATKEAPDTSTAKAATAPAPDDGRKPDSPTDVSKPSWKYIARKTLREFTRTSALTSLRASPITVSSRFSRALLALVSLLGIFGQPEKTTAALLDIVQGIAPGSTVDMIRQPVEELTTSPAAGFTLIIGLATALWSASGYVGAFGRAMNRIYEIDEGRGFVKLRGTMLGVTLLHRGHRGAPGGDAGDQRPGR